MRVRALVVAVAVVAVCASSGSAARQDASISVSVMRGDGLSLVVKVTNDGPDPIWEARQNEPSYGDLRIALDKPWVLNSLPDKQFTTSPGWTCGMPNGPLECRKADNAVMSAGDSVTLTLETRMSSSSPAGSTDCYPENAGVTVFYYTQTDYTNKPHQVSAQGPAGGCTQASVGSIEVSYAALLKKQVAYYKTQKDALVKQRDDIQAQLSRARDKLESDRQADTDLGKQEGALLTRLAALKRFVEALRQSPAHDKQLPPDVLKDLQQREIVDATTDYLQGALLDAQAGKQAAQVQNLERQIASQQQLGKELDRRLNGELAALDPTLETTLEKIRVARREGFALARKRVAVQLDESDDEQAITMLGEKRDLADASLTELTVALTQASSHLTQVVLSSYGSNVFVAKLKTPDLQLQQIDQDLATTQDRIVKLYGLHQELEQHAREAALTLPASNDELSAQLAYGRYAEFGVNFSFDLIDVIQANIEGGGKGIVQELLKKIADFGLKYAFDKYQPEESGYPPGSTEDQINKEFNAGLKNSLAVPGWLRTGELRAIKEAVRKPSLDTLALGAGKLWEKFGSPVSGLEKAQTEALKKLPTRTWFEYVSKWIYVANRRDSVLAGMLKGPQFPTFAPTFPGNSSPKFGLVTTIVKDALKQLWKGYLDKQKANAWANYAMDYAIAASAIDSSRRAGDLLADAEQRYEALMQHKQQLLLEYDPTDFQVVTDKAFPIGTQLGVALSTNSPYAGPTWDVRLAGKDFPASTSGFGLAVTVLDTRGLKAGPKGLGLELRGG